MDILSINEHYITGVSVAYISVAKLSRVLRVLQEDETEIPVFVSQDLSTSPPNYYYYYFYSY